MSLPLPVSEELFAPVSEKVKRKPRAKPATTAAVDSTCEDTSDGVVSAKPVKARTVVKTATATKAASGDDAEKPKSTSKAKIKSLDTSVALDSKVAWLKNRIEENAKKAQAPLTTPAVKDSKQSSIDARILQDVLPFWDNENRGVPNPFIRSGLFSVKNSEARQYLQEAPIQSLSNYQVLYSGQELQQDDLSVWLALINLSRNNPMSDMVLFTGYQLIKDIGWRMHSDSYKRVRDSIQRLKVTGIEILSGEKLQGYSGSLIRDYGWENLDDKGNSKWMVRFEPRLALLFQEDSTTLLEWEMRKKIGSRATLALWLHSFYTSHRDPIPYKIEKLHQLCRSGDTLSSFRRNIKNALAKLVDIEFLNSFDVINEFVQVQKRMKPKLVRVSKS